jgi:hypothetical protein
VKGRTQLRPLGISDPVKISTMKSAKYHTAGHRVHAFDIRVVALALGSAVMVRQFPLISGVTCLRILAERCVVNEYAVKQCADRWYAAGRRVQIGLPEDEHDKDFNDQVMREQAS